jgi:hypothetical protein
MASDRSVSTKGYFEQHQDNAGLNNVTAKKDADGSVTVTADADCC